MSSTRRYLVTGAGGFVGSHLVERLLQCGQSVRAFVRYTSSGSAGMLDGRAADVEIVRGDLRDQDAIRRAMRGMDAVVHLGALCGIPYSFTHPEEVVAVNVVGTTNVLHAARDAGSTRVVVASTSEVYGSAQCVPMDEDHPVNPQSPYAASKVAAEAMALSFHRSFETPVTVVRLFNCFGPRQSARAIIPTIVSQALQSDELILGSLDPRRDFTYIDDVSRALHAAATRPEAIGQVMHLGTGRDLSIADLVDLIGQQMGRTLRVRSTAERLRPAASEVSRLCSNNARARRLLDWTPAVSLEDGLARTIAWIDAHRHLYRPERYET